MFCDTVQNEINCLAEGTEYINMGSFNAKVCKESHEQWPSVVGKYGLGNRNDRGLSLVQLCTIGG